MHTANIRNHCRIIGICYLCENFCGGLRRRLTENETYIMVYLTRLEHFNAAHKLYNLAWSKEQNDAVFGKCANENWHGHNYDLYVTIKGEPDPDTGFLFDAKRLSGIIREHI